MGYLESRHEESITEGSFIQDICLPENSRLGQNKRLLTYDNTGKFASHRSITVIYSAMAVPERAMTKSDCTFHDLCITLCRVSRGLVTSVLPRPSLA